MKRVAARDLPLLVVVGAHAAVVIFVTIGTFLMGEDTPNGYIALAALSLGKLCPTCMVAALARGKATKRRGGPRGHEDH